MQVEPRCERVFSALLLLLLVQGMIPLAAETGSTEEPGGEFPFLGPFLCSDFMHLVGEQLAFESMLEERRSGVYVGRKTGLMWQARDNGKDTSWGGARNYCERLELAGFDDWRLPSIEELETLHVVMSNRQFKIREEIVLTACCPWSDTKMDDTRAWNFSFRARGRFSGSFGYSFDQRALCVRDPQPGEPLPEELEPPIPPSEEISGADSAGA